MISFTPTNHPNLDGNWQASRAELAGSIFSEAVTKTLVLKLNGDTYELQNDFGTLKFIDNDKLEITGTKGPNNGKTFKAIYELEGGELMICYDLAGNSFPSSFATQEKTKLFLVHYSLIK
jgi:uncharacterized protein (TIGR03067 family)